MRLTSFTAAFTALSLAALPTWPTAARAQEGCTGENCPPPTDQGGGGHRCEKKEQITS